MLDNRSNSTRVCLSTLAATTSWRICRCTQPWPAPKLSRMGLQTGWKSFKTAEGVSPTLSVGVVVAHHLDPLADALELAREAEKDAKGHPNKDALAITVSKRSGVDRTIVGGRIALHERLEAMIVLLRQDAIGKGVAYELQELHRVLGKTKGLPPEAVVREALRIVKRKRESGGAKAAEKQTLDQFERWLKTDKAPVDELAKEMIVAAVFSDAADLAYGRLTVQRRLVTP